MTVPPWWAERLVCAGHACTCAPVAGPRWIVTEFGDEFDPEGEEAEAQVAA